MNSQEGFSVFSCGFVDVGEERNSTDSRSSAQLVEFLLGSNFINGGSDIGFVKQVVGKVSDCLGIAASFEVFSIFVGLGETIVEVLNSREALDSHGSSLLFVSISIVLSQLDLPLESSSSFIPLRL